MSVLYPLIQALVLFAVAPLLSGITRVARARLHNRRGPGVLQEYRDIIKLLGRQSVGPDASGWVFRLTPYVMVGVMLTIATALPVVTVGSPLPLYSESGPSCNSCSASARSNGSLPISIKVANAQAQSASTSGMLWLSGQ